MYKPIKIIPNSDIDWLKIKLNTIGGSDISAIVGKNPFSTPLDVFNIKTGLKNYDDPNWSMKVGTYLEDGVCALWEAEYGNKVIKYTRKNIVYIHPEYSFISGTFDRQYYLKDSKGRGILEIKTTRFNFDYEDIPLYWIMQIQWYLGISGLKKGTIAYFEFRTTELKSVDIDFDSELFDYLVEAAKDFWYNNVLKKIPPNPINSKDIISLYPVEKEGSVIEADDYIQKLYSELMSLTSEIKPKNDRIEEIKEEVKIYMKDVERISFFDDTLFTWRVNKAGNRIFRIK